MAAVSAASSASSVSSALVLPREIRIHSSSLTKYQITQVHRMNGSDDRVKFISEEWGIGSFVIDVNRLTPDEIAKKKIKICMDFAMNTGAWDVGRTDYYTLDFSEAWGQSLVGQQKDLQKTAEKLHQSYAPLDTVQLVRGSLVQHYTHAFNTYSETHARTKRLFEEFPAAAPVKPAGVDYTQFYQKDLPPRNFTIQVVPAKKGVDGVDEKESKAESLDPDESQMVKVHDFILISNGGPLLHIMFKLNSQESLQRTMILEGASAEAVNKMVKFIYTGKVDIADDREAQQVYRLADRYLIEDLRQICEAGATRQDLADSDPTTLMYPEAFAKYLSDRTTTLEMDQDSADALKRLDQVESFYLTRHITKMTQ